MTGQKTITSEKVFRDISLTAKPDIYFRLNLKKINFLPNNLIKIFQIVPDLCLHKNNQA